MAVLDQTHGMMLLTAAPTEIGRVEPRLHRPPRQKYLLVQRGGALADGLDGRKQPAGARDEAMQTDREERLIAAATPFPARSAHGLEGQLQALPALLSEEATRLAQLDGSLVEIAGHGTAEPAGLLSKPERQLDPDHERIVLELLVRCLGRIERQNRSRQCRFGQAVRRHRKPGCPLQGLDDDVVGIEPCRKQQAGDLGDLLVAVGAGVACHGRGRADA